MPPLGNVNTHSTWGQATSDWPEGPCKERYFGVPFTYNGQWKINMPVKSIFKNKREVSNLVLLVEYKSVSCASILILLICCSRRGIHCLADLSIFET